MGALDGRVAVVTGASRGIGASIATVFAAAGAHVAVVARTAEAGDSRLPGSIAEVVETIRAAGGIAEPIVTDLTRDDDVEALPGLVEAALGPVDILVNNAGANFYGPALETALRKYDVMFQMMVRAPFRLGQLVVPGMVERGYGVILNITSKQARHPMGPPYPHWASDGCTPYGMAKAALDRWTTGLAAELDGTGVRVNSLGTGALVMTPGVALVSPHTPDNVPVEPDGAMAEAALILCTGDRTTGRIAYSMELLGTPPPADAPWALSATF